MKISDLDTTVARMKKEILADVAAGKVPATVTSFTAWNDHVDANKYGDFLEGIELEFGGRVVHPDAQKKMDVFINKAQSQIHEWLIEAGLTQDLAVAQSLANAKAIEVMPVLLSALVLIERELRDHPDFAKGNSKVHFAVHKARSAIQATV